MPLVLVTAPPVEPLELEETKAFAKIEVEDDDALMGQLISAVRHEVERIGGIALLEQTWDLVLERFPLPTMKNPGAAIELPRRPVTSVTSISYVDSAGATQVLGSSNYVLNAAARPPVIVPALGVPWPAERQLAGAGNVTVRFVAGMGTDKLAVEAAAGDLLQAMRMAVAELYVRREVRVTGTIVNELPVLAGAIGRYQLRPMGIM